MKFSSIGQELFETGLLLIEDRLSEGPGEFEHHTMVMLKFEFQSSDYHALANDSLVPRLYISRGKESGEFVVSCPDPTLNERGRVWVVNLDRFLGLTDSEGAHRHGCSKANF